MLVTHIKGLGPRVLQVTSSFSAFMRKKIIFEHFLFSVSHSFKFVQFCLFGVGQESLLAETYFEMAHNLLFFLFLSFSFSNKKFVSCSIRSMFLLASLL